MSVCTVCSSPAPFSCMRCKSVFYCSPAHQRADWRAGHRAKCPLLALEALTVFKPCDEETLRLVTMCLANTGYHKEVGILVQLNKVFWWDEQIWDAFKDVPGPGGKKRLYYVSGMGTMERVTFLLARGAKVNGEESPALIAASGRGRLEFVREHLSKGKALVDDQGTFGVTALLIACEGGYTETVRELCRMGADINHATENGGTALMIACQKGHLQVVLELIMREVNVNALGEGGTALFSAIFGGYLEIVRLLCASGANVNEARADGFTVLMAASQEGHVKLVLELVDRGANMNTAMWSNGRTAMILASQNGHLEVVRELCDKGALVDSVSMDGVTPLMMASQYGYVRVVRELCSRGADVNRSDANGSCLTLSSSLGYLEVVQELCKRGANVNFAAPSNGCTALMWATQNGHLEVVRELCDRGALVNAAKTEDGATALMKASFSGHLGLVCLLLNKGALKSTVNFRGDNAFDLAMGPFKANLQSILRP